MKPETIDILELARAEDERTDKLWFRFRGEVRILADQIQSMMDAGLKENLRFKPAVILLGNWEWRSLEIQARDKLDWSSSVTFNGIRCRPIGWPTFVGFGGKDV